MSLVITDVTKDMTYGMLECLVQHEKRLNFYTCVVLRKSNRELIFGRFWYNGELGVETHLLNDSKKIYSMIYKEVGLIDEPCYFFISKPVTNMILKATPEIIEYGLSERKLFPLNMQEYLQIQYA